MHEVDPPSTVSSTVHISDDEDDHDDLPGPLKMRCLWDSFEKELKQK